MDIGLPELLIIFVIVVLFFGSGRLIKLGSELGNGIREFRQGLQGTDKKEESSTLEAKETHLTQ
jgi:sec-independent protein translocase protein TatA